MPKPTPCSHLPVPTGGEWDLAGSLSPEQSRACPQVGSDGERCPGTRSLFPPSRMEEGEGKRLPCVGRMRVREPGGPVGPGLCRRLGGEAVLGWCLPEWGCVCPKPLQHLCIRMCSSLSSLLACALPRSLPTTTLVPGEGIFFFFFSPLCLYLTCHSPRTSQGGRATCSIMHNSCPFLSLPGCCSHQSPAETPRLRRSPPALPRPWGWSRWKPGGTWGGGVRARVCGLGRD